jgi:hypothetical protein
MANLRLSRNDQICQLYSPTLKIRFNLLWRPHSEVILSAHWSTHWFPNPEGLTTGEVVILHPTEQIEEGKPVKLTGGS